MENEVKKISRRDVIQIIFLIVMFIAALSIFSAVLTIHKYSTMLKDPMAYNMEYFKLQSCSCIDNFGNVLSITPMNRTVMLKETEKTFDWNTK